MIQSHIRGRRRILDPAKKSRLCELVAKEAYSVEQAADALDVSLRTVQRERKFDQDFDHEVRLSLQQPPDPLKLMEHAARTHWRAAAWLFERRNPEEYARKPINTANTKQVWAALQFVTEAALRAVAPEQRVEVYNAIEAASKEAHDCCFPAFGPWGHPRRPKLPPTPLYDETMQEATCLKYGLPLPTPEELAAKERQAALREQLKQRLAEKRRAEALNQPWLSGENEILSPKTDEATNSAATECTPPTDDDLERDAAVIKQCPDSLHANDDFQHPDANDPRLRIQLYQERLDRHKRQERQKGQSRQKTRRSPTPPRRLAL